MAGSSSDPLGTEVHHPEDDPSLALAIALQQDEDAALALALQEEEAAPRAAAASAASATAASSSSAGRPGVTLAWPAHRAVQHLGRGTCKKIAALNRTETLSLRGLLKLFNGPRQHEVLMLVDSGQRQRVEAELVALAHDFGL